LPAVVAGNQGGDGGVVQGRWQTQAGLVESRDGIVGYEWVSAADQGQVMA